MAAVPARRRRTETPENATKWGPWLRRIRAWDVVNEAVDVTTASGYRESVFYQTLGEDYIAEAFRWLATSAWTSTK